MMVRRSWLRATAALMLVTQIAGCYHYAPVSGSIQRSGSRVTLSVTDGGRVALADALGPGARRVYGQLVELNDSIVVVQVTEVEHLDLGLPIKWAGEPVRISRNFVGEVRERRLSQARTWLFAGLLVAGAAALSAVAISGFGSDPPGGPGNGPPQQDTRIGN